MKALRFTLKTKKLELTQIPKPQIQESTDVLIQIAYCGICGTDLHMMQGEFPVEAEKPVTLGHEFAGIIVDTGKEVINLKIGDRVAVDPNRGCHSCASCHPGYPHFCTGDIKGPGCLLDGGWADYVLVHKENVHKLPDSIKLEHGALIEPLSCLTHGWDIIGPITLGMKILVIGAGIIGNLWVSNFHLRGHKNVTVSEPNMNRLNLLRKLDMGYNLITPEKLKQKQEADPNFLFDLIVDCSGHAPATEHAITLLQRGGKYCIFGVAPPNADIKFNIFNVTYNEYKIVGVKINPYSFPKAVKLVEAMGTRYLNLENLGLQVFSLNEYKEALEQLKKGAISKAIFKLN